MTDWRTLSSRVAYENPYMSVREDQVLNPAGQKTVYGVISSKSDSVYVVPVDSDGNTYLVNQFRYPLEKTTWECVAGRSDGESPDTAALRELVEETGFSAEYLTKLTEIDIANGISTFHSHVYLAEGLTKITDELDATDGILSLKKVTFDEIIDMIMCGEIQCSQSIAAFFVAREYLHRRN